MVRLDQKSKKSIEECIARAEQQTSGEIRVHLKSKCGKDVLGEAQKVFRRLKMHRTKERNGVLLWIALESKSFAIMGDQGIHRCVGENFWNETRDKMLSHFQKGDIQKGIEVGVENVGEKLKIHFPRKSDDRNELPNTVTSD